MIVQIMFQLFVVVVVDAKLHVKHMLMPRHLPNHLLRCCHCQMPHLLLFTMQLLDEALKKPEQSKFIVQTELAKYRNFGGVSIGIFN